MMIRISKRVADAVALGFPVVALESTIITHGMPYPINIETALAVEEIIERVGVVPATIAVLDGEICVGLSKIDIERIGSKEMTQSMMKLSRRDLPYALAAKKNGSTTVAATMICASRAGITIFVTGGIGGVHRGGESSLDISADLQELAHTNVGVVCAGAKAILDIGRTLEVLETLGVPVIGYGTDQFPAFYYSQSGFSVDAKMNSAQEVAELLHAKWMLELNGGVLIANPIPREDALNKDSIEEIISVALQEAHQHAISGKDITPFLLDRVVQHSAGASLKCNIALIKNNALVGAHIAKSYSELRLKNPFIT